MYRQIFTPTENNPVISLTIPREWYGKTVEVIAFPISAPTEPEQAISDDDFYKLAGAWESET
jgi:hypothetical protein